MSVSHAPPPPPPPPLAYLSLQGIPQEAFIVLSGFTGYEANFNPATPGSATTQGIPYDYDSIMHYNAYAFSRDSSQPTIEPKSQNISLNRLGQRRGFSQLDLHHVNVLYCGGTRVRNSMGDSVSKD